MRTRESTLALPRSPTLVAGAALLVTPLVAWLVVRSPALTGLVAAGIAVQTLLVLRPTWGLYLLVGGGIFEEVNVNAGFALLGLGDLAAFAMLPAWAMHRLLRPAELRLPRGWMYGALALGWIAVSLLLGVSPDKPWGQFARLVTYCVAMLAVIDLAREEDVLDHVLRVLVVAGVLQALLALPEAGAGRLRGLVDQPNLLGMKLAFGVIPAAGLLLRSRGLARIAYGGALFIMLVAVVLTISRGTYIGLGVAFLWWMRDQRRLILALLVVVGGVLWIVEREGDSRRIEHISERFEMNDVSALNRWQVQLNSLKTTAQHPFFGVGFAQFTELDRVVTVARQAKRGAHNAYAATAASSGVPALVLVLIFLAYRVRDLRRSRAAFVAAGAKSRALLVSTYQAILLYQCVSLLVRGAKMPDLLLLGCCAAAGMLLPRAEEEGEPAAEEASPSALPASR